MHDRSRKNTALSGGKAPILLGALFILATALLVATLFRPVIAQAVAAYLAMLVTIVLAAMTWRYIRANQESLEATREALAFIRAEAEANRPALKIEIDNAWFDPGEVQTQDAASVLIHLRAGFTNSSKSVFTTVTAKAAFVHEQAEDSWGTILDLSFFRNPRPHHLTVPPGDTVESTILISAETRKSLPDQLEIELVFSHPFEDRLGPFRVLCPRLGNPLSQLNEEESGSEISAVVAPLAD